MLQVLRLFPGETNDALQGSLEIHQLPPLSSSEALEVELHDQHSGFDALSYVWGSEIRPEDGFNILIKNEKLDITPSLDSFLRRLRYPTKDRVVWADAACINQKDITEREKQVALMPRVYMSADNVLVDLGEETEDSDEALAIMDATWKKHILAGVMVAGQFLTLEETILHLGVDMPDHSEREQLEAVELPSMRDPEGTRLLQMYLAKETEGHALRDLLITFQLSKCTRRRDRYFALMGLSRDVTSSEAERQIDYRSPIETIVSRPGHFLIKKGPEMLMRSGLYYPRAPGISSWVGDFTQVEKYYRSGTNPLVLGGVNPNAAKNTEFYISTSPEQPNTILLSPSSRDISTGSQDSLVAFTWFLWASAVGGMGQAEALNWTNKITHNRFGGISWVGNRMDPKLLSLFERVVAADEFRAQPVQTVRGYFASLPDCFLPDDEIWVVKGLPVPRLLRKSETFDWGCSYQFVGACYVHGVMNGEILGNDESAACYLIIH
ncbi:heterokaryon incompatibility protein-domain-containing protein [Cladorrhinum sp. PSN332]|nr:heterokaryon incompatibility protein-domain-containing protein [Cladorrhinum sp. PSN332]